MKDITLEKRTELVLPYLEGRVLDYACGQNKLCSKYKGFCIGADFRGTRADFLLDSNYKTTSLLFKDEFFDTVSIVSALNHIEAKQRPPVLKEVFRLLCKGGRLVILCVPVLEGALVHGLKSIFYKDYYKREIKNGDTGISKKEVIRLCSQAGFRLETFKRKSFNNLYLFRRPT